MNRALSAEKLADVQRIAAKLAVLPESARLYIAGYTEGVAAMSERKGTAAADSA